MQQKTHLPGSAMIWAPGDAGKCSVSAESTAAGMPPAKPAALQEPQPMVSRSIWSPSSAQQAHKCVLVPNPTPMMLL